MKRILIYMTLCFFVKTFSQNYQNNLENNQFVIKELPKKMKITKVSQKKLAWTRDEIYGFYEDGVLLFGLTGLLKNEIVNQYFKKEDLKFIESQYLLNNLQWDSYKGKYEILDSLQIRKMNDESLKTHKMKYYYHSLSNPIFSLDKKLMIIKIDLYCGFMCSHQCIYLFKKKNNSWVKIEEWNCLSA